MNRVTLVIGTNARTFGSAEPQQPDTGSRITVSSSGFISSVFEYAVIPGEAWRLGALRIVEERGHRQGDVAYPPNLCTG